MYPLHIFNLFPPFPRNNKVFVAMDFDDKFRNRWREVIKPAIESVSINGIPLEPYRADTQKINDSIITEITSGIANCRLFFADLTTTDLIDKRTKDKSKDYSKAIRNGNVMYEIGIAHAVRLPAEVILFRSDKDRLLFDIANIRISNYYDPDNKPEESIIFVKDALESAIHEIDLQKHLSVQRAVDSLTIDSRRFLLEVSKLGETRCGTIKCLFNDLSGIPLAIERSNTCRQLIELGIVSASYPRYGSTLLTDVEEEQSDYNLTEFGRAVVSEVVSRAGLL